MYQNTTNVSSSIAIESLNDVDSNEFDELRIQFFESIKNLLNKTFMTMKTIDGINPECLNSLNRMIEPDGLEFLIKFALGTSFFTNDLNSFKECRKFQNENDTNLNIYTQMLSNNYTIELSKLDDLKYIIFYIDESISYPITDLRSKISTAIVGFCIPNKCGRQDYARFVYSFNEVTDRIIYNFTQTSEKIPYDYFNGTDRLIVLEKHDLNIYELAPALVACVIVLITLIPPILYCCYPCWKWSLLSRKKSRIIYASESYDLNNNDVRNTNNNNNRMLSNIEREEVFNFDNTESSEDEHFEHSEEMSYQNPNIEISYVKQSSLNPKFFFIIINKIFIKNNFLQFFDSLHASGNKNETGIKAIKGLKGISLLLSILGCIYLSIFSSPFKIYNKESHEKMIEYFFFCGITFGLRYSRRIFYALSGYTLVFKFLYYLDSLIEKRKANKNSRSTININENSRNNELNYNTTTNTNTNNNNNNNANSNSDERIRETNKKNNRITDSSKRLYSRDFTYSSSNTYDSDEETYESDEEEEIENNPVSMTNISEDLKNYLSFKDYFRFLYLQLHKYILFVLSLLICRYSYFYLKSLVYNPKPLFHKLKQEFETLKFNDIISMIFLLPINDQTNFLLALNEIRYFIVFSFIIFIGYKYRKRIDILLLFLFVLCFVYKLVIFILESDHIYPVLVHYSDEANDKFFTGTLFNASFFIIGIFFGKVNYIIQKGIKTSDKLYKKGKNFLKYALYFGSFINNLKDKKFKSLKLIWMALSFLVVGLLIFSYSIFYIILDFDLKKDYLYDMNNHFGLKIFYMFDNEVFIFFLIFNFMLVSYPGKNFLYQFISADNWRFLTKPYFSLICVLPIILLDFIHHSNYRIRIDIFNMLFYSIIVSTLVLFISIATHVLVEIPLKKLLKFLAPKKI